MEKITVVKDFMFEAAHYLPEYKGPCAKMHGHSYRLQVGVTAYPSTNGMVMDFKKLSDLVKSNVIVELDHTVLNDYKENFFPNEMPTAENMVVWMKMILTAAMQSAQILGALELDLTFIRLWETRDSYAEWRKDRWA